jgi:hypothetical protein
MTTKNFKKARAVPKNYRKHSKFSHETDLRMPADNHQIGELIAGIRGPARCGKHRSDNRPVRYGRDYSVPTFTQSTIVPIRATAAHMSGT